MAHNPAHKKEVSDFTGELDWMMDHPALSHLLNSGGYRGTLEVLSNRFQFTENGANSHSVGFMFDFGPRVRR